MYEQIGLFDLKSNKKFYCIDCLYLTHDKYRTEGKIIDFCNEKQMYIDRCLTVKENCKLFKIKCFT